VNPVSQEKKILLFHIIGEIKLSLFLKDYRKEEIVLNTDDFIEVDFCRPSAFFIIMMR